MTDENKKYRFQYNSDKSQTWDMSKDEVVSYWIKNRNLGEIIKSK